MYGPFEDGGATEGALCGLRLILRLPSPGTQSADHNTPPLSACCLCVCAFGSAEQNWISSTKKCQAYTLLKAWSDDFLSQLHPSSLAAAQVHKAGEGHRWVMEQGPLGVTGAGLSDGKPMLGSQSTIESIYNNSKEVILYFIKKALTRFLKFVWNITCPVFKTMGRATNTGTRQ